MKKRMSILLAMLLALSLTGCGERKGDDYEVEKYEAQILEEQEEEQPAVEQPAEEQPAVEQPAVEQPAETPAEQPAAQSNGLRPEFKSAMDSYEDFCTEYCDFMEEYKANPTDIKLLTKYGKLVTELTEMEEEFAKWEGNDLNTEELKYYTEVNARVVEMLAKAAS